MRNLSSVLRSSLLALVLSCVAAGNLRAAATPASERVVVIISLDGFANFYLDDPKAEIPTLRELMAKGVRAESMKASNPTVTWPNHTSIVTGVHPARHGVVGNNYFDRATNKRVVLIADPVFDKEELVKVPTIYDAARSAGLKTAAIRWPASRNAKTLDWTIPDVAYISQLKKYGTPALISEASQAGIWAEIDRAEKTEANGRYFPSDKFVTDLFDLILTKHRPNVGLLHLIDVDHTQHLNGPRSPQAYADIKANDARVREVWDTLQKEYPGKATLIVVSDHGFSAIKKQILPNVVLKKAGLLQEREGDETKPLVRVVPQGGSAMIYILDKARRDETVKKIKQAFAKIEHVSKVAGPDELPSMGVARAEDDPHAPDVMIFAELGYAFGDTAAGDLPFNEKPERKGSHGHDASIPDLHAIFIAWGAGIKQGVRLPEISNTDVTPTAAKLLGLKMEGLDGKVLTDALSE
jgi:predicted AlkP superfamily pyrophosphatase or phosphodiesterase